MAPWGRSNGRGTGRVIAAAAVLCAGVARAGSLDLGWNTEANYKMVMSYGVSLRTEKQSQALINGPIDPLNIPATSDSFINGTGFTHTGLPHTANFDDGDRNFKRFSLVNNRISSHLELQLTHDNYGAVFSGDGFY